MEILEHKVNLQKAKIKRIINSKIDKKYIFFKKLQKNKSKYQNKEIKDKNNLSINFPELQKDLICHFISDMFDSPNLIKFIDDKYKIEYIYIATWAITDRGLTILKELSDNNIKIKLLLDKTYSYKWVFASGANKLLKNVEYYFTENHSKMILIKTKEYYLSFLGSMNLSNNPRIENIVLFEGIDVYNFYTEFIDNLINKKNERTSIYESLN